MVKHSELHHGCIQPSRVLGINLIRICAYVQESTQLTDANKEASLVKALEPPSLQEAVRPHNLKALYNHSSVQVQQGDQKPLYVCTVETGCRNKSGAAPPVQVGTTSDYAVAIIAQVLVKYQLLP